MRRAGKAVAWVLAVLIILIAAVVIFALTFDWNRARPWVDDKVSQAIGRPFAINGDLKVGWRRPPSEIGWRAWVPWPRFSAENITVANPDWTKRPNFASLDEIDFQVAVLPLLAHKILIPTINLVNPSVDAERLLDGRNNWTFNLAKSAQPSAWTLDLHDITFDKGNVAYSDQQQKADITGVIDTLGNPLPVAEVLKQQQEASRKESAAMVGARGSAKLASQVTAVAASEASAAAAASAASAASAENASGTVAMVPGSAAASATTATTAAQASAASPSVAASGASDATASAEVGDAYKLGWSVKGTYKQTSISGSGKIGGVLALQNTQRPFPIQADVRIGDTHVAVVGTLTDPAHLAALDLRLWLSGISMSHLYAVTGVTLPATPPYATEGRLVAQLKTGGSVFKYEDFTGRVGGSDLNGTLTFAQRQPRALLSGTLVSNLLQFSDLAPIIGADSKASQEKRGATQIQPADKALPVEEFHTDRWKALDADVKFTGKRIIRQADLPISGLYTHVIMKDGVLSLDPLNFGVAGGTLSSDIHLDGSGVPLKGRFSVNARHLKLKQLFPTFAPMKTSFGEVNGDAALSATGNSPAALAAKSNGEIKVLVNDGAISNTLLEEAGLNVANIVAAKLFGDKTVKINCAATDFVVTNGVLDSRVFALDTEDALISVDGNINLSTEVMNLKVHPHTKGFRIFSLRSPLYVKGTFKKPDVGVDIGALALRGGAAIGLGLIATPFAALIPLLAPSTSQDSPCATLVAAMKQQPKAPPPGTRQQALPPISTAAPTAASTKVPVGAADKARASTAKSGMPATGVGSTYRGN